MSSSAQKHELQRKTRELAKNYSIPERELEIEAYSDNALSCEVVRLHFRTPDQLEKYCAEVAISQPLSSGTAVVEKQIKDTLNELERAWLSEGCRLTFYKGQGFFYQQKEGGGRACLEVQCTICNHMEVVQENTSVMNENLDVFLMKTLPRVRSNCECNPHRYES